MYPSYPLEDGRVVRLYHSSVGRNWRGPRVEPAESIPDTLTVLQFASILPPPPPPQLGKREMPVLSTDLALVPPLPSRVRHNEPVERCSVEIIVNELVVEAPPSPVPDEATIGPASNPTGERGHGGEAAVAVAAAPSPDLP